MSAGLPPKRAEVGKGESWGMAGGRRTHEGHADEWGLVMLRTPEKTGGGGPRIKMIVVKAIARLQTYC